MLDESIKDLGPYVGAALNSIKTPGSQRWPMIRTGNRSYIPRIVRWLVFQRDGGRCLSCGMQLTIQTARLDHIIPWSAGGTDRSENLRILCHDCNSSRSNLRGYLDTWSARRTPVCFGCVSCHHLDDCGREVAEPLPVTPELVAAFCGFCGMVSRTLPGETL